MKHFLLFLALFATALVAQASSDTATIGQPVTIVVSSDGTPPFTYQWFKDGTAIPGATSSTHTIAAAVLADGGTYTARVANPWGNVLSDDAVLTVKGLPPTKATTTTTVVLAVSPQPRRLMLSQFLPSSRR